MPQEKQGIKFTEEKQKVHRETQSPQACVYPFEMQILKIKQFLILNLEKVKD